MANHKSAAKRSRQSVRRKTINSKRKSVVKTIEKKLMQAISGKQLSTAQDLLKSFSSFVDRAAKNKVVSKKHASRKKSQLSTRVHAISK